MQLSVPAGLGIVFLIIWTSADYWRHAVCGHKDHQFLLGLRCVHCLFIQLNKKSCFFIDGDWCIAIQRDLWSRRIKHGAFIQWYINVGPASKTVDQYCNSTGWVSRVLLGSSLTAELVCNGKQQWLLTFKVSCLKLCCLKSLTTQTAHFSSKQILLFECVLFSKAHSCNYLLYV